MLSAHQLTPWKSLCVPGLLPAHTAGFSSPWTTMYSWIKKCSFSRRGLQSPEDSSSFALLPSPQMLHLGIILLKKSSPALPADTAHPQVAPRAAVTQLKDVMFHTSLAKCNISLAMAEGAVGPEQQSLLGGCGSGHNRAH